MVIDNLLVCYGNRGEAHPSMGHIGKDSRGRMFEPKSEGQVEVLKLKIRKEVFQAERMAYAKEQEYANFGKLQITGFGKA